MLPGFFYSVMITLWPSSNFRTKSILAPMAWLMAAHSSNVNFPVSILAAKICLVQPSWDASSVLFMPL